MKDNEKKQKRTEPKPPKKVSERYLYNSGLYYLKRYTASINHFKMVMMRKIRRSCAHHTEQNIDTCAEMLEQATEKLIEQGMLNDDSYSHGMVNSYRKRGLSEKAIFARLGQKGLPQDIIAKALEKIDAQIIDTQMTQDPQSPEMISALTHARKKRLGPYAREISDDPKVKSRAFGSFARAGFSFAIAKIVLEQKEPPDSL